MTINIRKEIINALELEGWSKIYPVETFAEPHVRLVKRVKRHNPGLRSQAEVELFLCPESIGWTIIPTGKKTFSPIEVLTMFDMQMQICRVISDVVERMAE